MAPGWLSKQLNTSREAVRSGSNPNTRSSRAFAFWKPLHPITLNTLSNSLCQRVFNTCADYTMCVLLANHVTKLVSVPVPSIFAGTDPEVNVFDSNAMTTNYVRICLLISMNGYLCVLSAEPQNDKSMKHTLTLTHIVTCAVMRTRPVSLCKICSRLSCGSVRRQL